MHRNLSAAVAIAAQLSLLPACAAREFPPSPEGVDGRWVGTSSALGRPLLLELTIAGAAGRLNAYMPLESGYDVRVVSGRTVRVEGAADGRIQFTLQEGDGDRVFEGAVRGDTLEAASTKPGEPARLHLVRARSDRTMEDLVGLYESGGRTWALTWREYGDFRLVDVADGTSRTLILADGDAFRDVFAGEGGAAVRVPVSRGRGGPALTWGGDAGAVRAVRADGWRQERVRFASSGVELAGTVLFPPGQGPHPGVVLVHGSGPIYRTALLERAVTFVRAGLAVLIYDKRGTGASGGTEFDVPFEVLAGDAAAAFEALRSHEAVDPGRVGLQGHSQAGQVIPLVVDRVPAAFAIMVSAPGVRGDALELYEKTNDVRRAGFGADVVERAADLRRRVHAWVLTGEGDAAVLGADLLAAQSEPWFDELDLPRMTALPPRDHPMIAAAREKFAFDATAHASSFRDKPVLLLWGTGDEAVPPEASEEGWRDALERAGVPRYQLEMIAGADHGLRRPDNGGRRVIVPRYWDVQLAWLRELGMIAP